MKDSTLMRAACLLGSTAVGMVVGRIIRSSIAHQVRHTRAQKMTNAILVIPAKGSSYVYNGDVTSAIEFGLPTPSRN